MAGATFSAALLLGALFGALIGAAPVAALTRRLHGVPISVWQEAPGKLAKTLGSCSWTGAECRASMAPVLSASQPLIDSSNYPAWASAYVAASDVYCTQYSKDKCAWPCEYEEGIGCRVDGHLYYNVWNCDQSIAAKENFCGQEPQARSQSACLRQPACSWTASEPPNERCTSTFAANLTSRQRLHVFGDLYYVVKPRQLLGCCKGSTFFYRLDSWCNAAFDNVTGHATKESCCAVPGCVWDTRASDVCVASPQTKVALQFAYKPTDPLAAVLTKLAGECAAITDARKCSSYKPVAVDPSKVQAYMSQRVLEALNQPVSNSTCPLPSVPPPWV